MLGGEEGSRLIDMVEQCGGCASKQSLAELMAAFTSDSVPLATVAISAPVAGFITGRTPPSEAPMYSFPMKIV